MYRRPLFFSSFFCKKRGFFWRLDLRADRHFSKLRARGVRFRLHRFSCIIPFIMEASLYIHIPFCAGACNYCNFYSVAVGNDERRLDRYVERLLADVEAGFERFAVDSVPTVYLGGGTPSVLGSGRLERLLAGLVSLLPSPPLEFTVEANPESADEAFYRSCLEWGVNRISLGVQTFHEPSRRAVQRVGSGLLQLQLQRQLELARDFYGGAFSVDLIAGLPLQTKSILLDDIERLLRFEPAHISLYSLSIEEGTPLEKTFSPDADYMDNLWLLGRDSLEQAGYRHYEVSNFSLPGKQSIHNKRYWHMKNWLGVGAGASGTLIDEGSATGRRYTTPCDLDAYLNGEAITEEEFLDSATLIKESLLMGFRSLDGPDAALFQRRFKHPLTAFIPHTIAVWRDKHLLAPDHRALSRDGLLFLNRFLIEAFTELDERKGPPLTP
jgi:oxygen-independent coproporphyrinogen-3 oxidase